MIAKSVSVRELLSRATSGDLHPRELFPALVAQFPTAITARTAGRTEGDTGPAFVLRDKEGKPFTPVFTDTEMARALPGLDESHLEEVSTLTVLRSALRLGHAGVVINPGPAQYSVDRHSLQLLFREYALVALRAGGGGWVPTHNDSLLIIELRPGIYTMPVFLTEVDALKTASENAGQPTFQSWVRIRERAQEAGTDGVVLQYGCGDQVALLRRHLTHLAGAPAEDPFDLLEAAVAESMGIANASAVWRCLANLDNVWLMADADGDPVSFGKTVDLFSSGVFAYQFIQRQRANNPGLPDLVPFLMPAQPYFRALAAQRPPVAINRGAEHSWVGMEDTIPQVLGLLGGTQAPVAAANEGSPVEARGGSWLSRLFGQK